ncbi:D-alanine--D-alanine ligase [Roseomonas sp. OT10]|uniref:D-alanine--D-alanine ligase n=1 Tax=Roseomonas cutis TaxID=2897332 RepID=UPI001E501AE4|nr:D-alanine--D-alanine ligase [Roseomonas sp. OT10]UFN47415.1 D-alanine--D-alanine ligase [Roseomonas sp. OT10]
MRVAVLLGGVSSEREVSLATGAQCAAALEQAGHAVTRIDVGADPAALIAALRECRAEVAFNALHGRFGEDGSVQGILDWLGLPYTHSGLRASALAMNKAVAKSIFTAAGLPVAPHALLEAEALAAADPFPRPYVVKPVEEGSSVGVHILRAGDNRRAEIARGWRFGAIMAEPYIPGHELSVGVMGDRALEVTEIIAARGEFYDYDAKYAEGGSHHVLPAPIPAAIREQAMAVALKAHQALGCRGVSRSDFRYDDTGAPSGDDTAGGDGRLVLLEVNTQPGMTPTSLVPEQAAHCGIAFPALCDWMVRHARHDGLRPAASPESRHAA